MARRFYQVLELRNFGYGTTFEFFVIISISLVVGILIFGALPDGALLGCDWGYPLTEQQAHKFIKRTTWNDEVNFGSPQTYLLIAIYYAELFRLLFGMGIDGTQFIKVFVALLVSISFFGFYDFLRALKIGSLGSLAGALFYAVSPILFNWLIMGWLLALIAMALAPIAVKYFSQAILKNRLDYLVVALVLWVIASMQSQAIVWYFIFFLAALLTVNAHQQNSKKFLFILCLMFALLNLFWIVPSLVMMDPNVIGGEIVNSEISIGSDSRFTAKNALKLWGSLYNFQYETSQGSLLGTLSFLAPIVAVVGYLLSRKRFIRIGNFFILLAFLVPAMALLLSYNREAVSHIPGVGIIRQTSRFLVVALFGISGLLALFVNSLAEIKKTWLRLIFISFVLLMFFVYLNPWFKSELTLHREIVNNSDVRLRGLNFSNDYFEAEKFLGSLKFNTRAIYFPASGQQHLSDNKLFYGTFAGVDDIFAALSPVPGTIAISDRHRSNAIFLDYLTEDPLSTYRYTSAQLFVFRKNMVANGIKGMAYFDSFLKSGDFEEIFNSKDLVILSRKEVIPNIYIDKKNYNGGNNTVVEYRKFSPTKIIINMHYASGAVPLVFGESFHESWRLHSVKYINHGIQPLFKYGSIFDTDQFSSDSNERNAWIANGAINESGPLYISKEFYRSIQNDNLSNRFDFDHIAGSALIDKEHSIYFWHANTWRVPIEEICKAQGVCEKNSDGTFNASFVLYFSPQWYFEIIYPLTALTLLALCLFLFVRFAAINIERIIKFFASGVTRNEIK